MTDLLIHTTAIAAAYLARNEAAPEALPAILRGIHEALGDLANPKAAPSPEPAREPAVSIRASVKPDYVTCLDCGTKGKMLKRHLAQYHDLTPEQYRARWSLPADHPLVAPNYAEKRRELAKSIGLGRKPGAKGGRKAKAA